MAPSGWPEARISHQRQEGLGISLMSESALSSGSPKHILLCPVSTSYSPLPSLPQGPSSSFYKYEGPGTGCPPSHAAGQEVCVTQYINIPAHRMTTQKTKLETVILPGLSSNKDLSLHFGQKELAGLTRIPDGLEWSTEGQGEQNQINPAIYWAPALCQPWTRFFSHTWSNSSSHKKSVK